MIKLESIRLLNTMRLYNTVFTVITLRKNFVQVRFLKLFLLCEKASHQSYYRLQIYQKGFYCKCSLKLYLLFKPLREILNKIIYTLFTLLSDFRLKSFQVAKKYAVG